MLFNQAILLLNAFMLGALAQSSTSFTSSGSSATQTSRSSFATTTAPKTTPGGPYLSVLVIKSQSFTGQFGSNATVAYADACTTSFYANDRSYNLVSYVEGPGFQAYSYTSVLVVDGQTASASYSQSCTLNGTTQAVCTATAVATDPSTKTNTAITTTITGNPLEYILYPVEQGANILSTNATGMCTVPHTAAGAATPSAVVSIFKTLFVPLLAVSFAAVALL